LETVVLGATLPAKRREKQGVGRGKKDFRRDPLPYTWVSSFLVAQCSRKRCA
jgi:hypothetical protein